MSSNKDSNKQNGSQGDWSTALEEWDEAPLRPSAIGPSDQTPSPDDAGASKATTVRPDAPVDADESAMMGVMADEDEEEEEERTVVGEIPAELLADAGRIDRGASSGLGQMFGGSDRLVDGFGTSESSAPVDDLFADIMQDDSPAVGAPVTTDRATPVAPAPEDPDEIEDVAIESVRPIAPPPPPAAVREATRSQVDTVPQFDADASSTSFDNAGADGELGKTPAGGLDVAAELPNLADEEASADGPKLLEPTERQYPQEEETAVFRTHGADTAQNEGTSADDDSEPPGLGGDRIHFIGGAGTDGTEHDKVEPDIPTAQMPPRDVFERVTWENERDASAVLLDAGLQAQWRQRVTLFLEEAEAAEDKAQRGRLLLHAAELLAMLGEDEQAAEVAARLRDGDSVHPLARRIERFVAARDHAWFDLGEALEQEISTATTTAEKLHLLITGAEIRSRIAGDDERADKLFEQAMRTEPDDPRPGLAGVVRALAPEDGRAASVAWSGAEALEPLRAASRQVDRIRVAGEEEVPADEELGAFEALACARAAMAKLDQEQVVRSLSALRAVEELASGALWLAVALGGTRVKNAKMVSAWLEQLADGADAAIARRMQVFRAVEIGDESMIVSALEAARSTEGALSLHDQVALGTLFSDNADKKALIDRLRSIIEGDGHGDSLVAAAMGSLSSVGSEQASDRLASALTDSGGMAGRIVKLGRGVTAAVDDETFAQLVQGFQEEPDFVWRLLNNQAASVSGRLDASIDLLTSWPSDVDSSIERDRSLAAGLVAELVRQPERAMEEYERARSISPEHEGVVRALGSFQSTDASTMLVELAEETTAENKASVLLFEAALLAGTEQADVYASRLRASFERDQSWLLPAFLSERAARQVQDIEAVLEWLRAQREVVSEDDMWAAFYQCREAWLMADREAGAAADLLRQASRARPEDVSLRSLYERFEEIKPEDWGSWRLELGERTKGPEKVRLLLQGAYSLIEQGDPARAAKLAVAAMEDGAGELAQLCVERAEMAGAPSSVFTDTLMKMARDESSGPEQRREALERLAELDCEGRKDRASALLWHQAILEETPDYLPSLRRLEAAYLGDGRDGDLEPVLSELVNLLQDAEVDGHAMVASRIRLRERDWEDNKELADKAADLSEPSFWALRESFAQARLAGQHERVVHLVELLAEQTESETESAALLAMAGEALAEIGRLDEASQRLQIALEREPSLTHAQLVLVDVLMEQEEFARAAEELENLARKSHIEEHQVSLWHRAGTIWLDSFKDEDRALTCFEEVADRDLQHADTFDRLRQLYAKQGKSIEMAALFERRLDAIDDEQERVELEVLRGTALAGVGDSDGAKQALAAALDANPDHVVALQAYAKLCSEQEDWAGAEQALIRLVRLVPDTEVQADLYESLAQIYTEQLVDYERAEAVLREVLKRRPDDERAQSRLVDVFRETGNAEKAIELCSNLLEAAKTPEEKRARTIQLSLIHEQVEGDISKAQTMLERVHKQSPSSAVSVRALAEFYQRHDNDKGLSKLMDRAKKDSQRALKTGRFSEDLFGLLEIIGDLDGRPKVGEVAKVVARVLNGKDRGEVGGIGSPALSVDIDELIAPALLQAPLRAFIKQAGHILDAAYPMELKALRASPLGKHDAALDEGINNAATAMGLSGIECYLSPALGPTCVPVGCHPPRVILGQSLVGSEANDVRQFLILRALKILQTRGSALARTAPIDLVPTVAAFVKVLAPSFEPRNVDSRRFAVASKAFSSCVTEPASPQLQQLALSIGESIDNKMATLNAAVAGWGDRAAFLALGGLDAALTGIAWAGGHASGPPASGKKRMTWIGRHAEARDLILFLSSEKYLQVLEKLGAES